MRPHVAPGLAVQTPASGSCRYRSSHHHFMNRRTSPPDYAAATEYLFALKARGGKFGIDRMAVLTASLDDPERAVPCVHVAGTNGKGSVAAMLDAILHAAGWRTGL